MYREYTKALWMGIENREIKEHRKKECMERIIHGLKKMKMIN